MSFGLYLTHFPLLCTFASAGFVVLAQYLPQGSSIAITTATGIAMSFAVAMLFERWVDRPAIRTSRRLGQTTGLARSSPLPGRIQSNSGG